jgi:serine protease Do
VGVNAAIYSPNGGSVGLGFAIPSNVVKKVVAQLRDHGRVDRAWLGVQTQSVDAALAAALKLPEPKGALVGAVQKDSPAAQAGIKRGDVILALDGSSVADPRDLSRRVGDLAAKAQAAFDIWRDGRRIQANVTLGALPDDEKVAAVAGPEAPNPTASLGLQLARGPKGEVVVVDVAQGGPADQAGLRQGDQIVEIDRQKTRNPGDVAAALRTARQEQRTSIALFLNRQGQPLYLAVPVPAPPARG